jgi:cation diffusion facilitator CzcD-associated flavoprotein CzcO
MVGYDAIIIGAGFSGIYQLHSLRDKLKLNTLIIESGKDLGGTWYWNRYPGARCDSESHTYNFTFSKEIFENWSWPEKYSKQDIILEYLNYVVEKLSLKKDMLFDNKVVKAHFDEKSNLWNIKTNKDKTFSCKYLISAVGCLSAANIPKINGLNKFKGKWYHTGKWPHTGVDFKNKRVAQIGVGSTGIQLAPEIAKSAKKLSIFQRSANFSIPARNEVVNNEYKKKIKNNYQEIKDLIKSTPTGHAFHFSSQSALDVSNEDRKKIYENGWKKGGLSFRGLFRDIITNLDANKTVVNFIKEKVEATMLNKDYAKVVTDFNYPFATRRPTLNTDYYETFNKDNVELIDISKDSIKEITETGIRTIKNNYELDIIVFATGYDAITGALLSIDIVGRNNTKLHELWKSGPLSYLGLQVPGFPNFFTITGPGSPSVLTNVPMAIEQHVEFITDCISHMEKNKYSTIETNNEYSLKWREVIDKAVDETLIPESKSSWLYGGNIEGKPKVFMPYPSGLPKYKKICEDIALKNYEGFNFDKN